MGKASRRKHTRARREETKLPLRGFCDFCASGDPARWAYRTRHDPTAPGESEGGWTACDTCKNLIEAGRHDALAERGAKTLIERDPMLAQVGVRVMARHLKELHDTFRASRSEKDHAPMTLAQYQARYGEMPSNTLSDAFMARHAPSPGSPFGRVTPPGDPVSHHVERDGESFYVPEGFTAEQLADPATVEHIVRSMRRERMVPAIPLTQPPKVRHWVGARTYIQALGAIYGETPRSDDHFTPPAPMMVAQHIIEAIMTAHPLVLEPEQMNAIDDDDWSFAEATDYAQMAHLPFEPLYLDFGGHQPVIVDLEAGPCRLHGAVIWRSGFFKSPTLAVAPIGGFEYLTGPLAEKLRAEGLDEDTIRRYIGALPGELSRPEVAAAVRAGTSKSEYADLARQQREQWRFQSAGVCWFGVKVPNGAGEYVSMDAVVRQEKGDVDVPVVFSTGTAIADVLDDERLKASGEAEAQILSGMFDNDDPAMARDWERMMRAATEMVARLAERALLGLYFIENAPVMIETMPLSRPERRRMDRDEQKGHAPAEVASIVYIGGKRSQGTRPLVPREIERDYRWERRAYAMHFHSNNRHYQNRPDLVKPCHKCAREYELNERARREGRDLPYPFTESPDCIKRWVEPTVCGPEGKPLKKKVRVRKRDMPHPDTRTETSRTETDRKAP